MAINTVINTNIRALNSHRNLGLVGNAQARANQRLSSGKRINSAADDAAGLAIADKMRAQIKGLDMASKNAEDATSLIQTAEGSLTEVSNMLQRMRELTTQAANDTNTVEDRQKIGKEMLQLYEEIDAISKRTEFNGKVLTNGDFENTALHFQIGANSGQKLEINIGDMQASVLDKFFGNDMRKAISNLVNGGSYKSFVKTIVSVTNNCYTKSISGGKNKTLSGANYKTKSVTNGKFKSYIKTFSGVKGGTFCQESAIIRTKFGSGAIKGSQFTTIKTIQDIKAKSFSSFLTSIDSALSKVADQRATLGASQNRLEYTIKNLNISSENLSAAKSRIEDTDMAKEMMNLTSANVLQQAATSMLAQANQAPNQITQLLG